MSERPPIRARFPFESVAVTGSNRMSHPTSIKTCSVEGCERKRIGRGFCHAHYESWYRTGRTPTRPVGMAEGKPKCSVEGCTRTARTRGYCQSDYALLLRKGFLQKINGAQTVQAMNSFCDHKTSKCDCINPGSNYLTLLRNHRIRLPLS